MSLVFLCISDCCVLATKKDSKIIGGRNALRGEFPASVSMAGFGRCGGTLISWEIVLTVAHCFVNLGKFVHPNSLTILAGVVNKTEESGEEQRSYVRDYIVHEHFEIKENEFEKYTIFDVAVAYLESPFVQTSTVRRAIFPATDPLEMGEVFHFIETAGDTCVSVGYGILAMTGVDAVVSDILKVIEFRLLPKSICFVERTIYNSEVCATAIGEPDRTAPGDSGSAFICGGYIIGMAKSGAMYNIYGKNVTILVFTLIGPYIEYFDLNLLTDFAASHQLHPLIFSLILHPLTLQIYFHIR